MGPHAAQLDLYARNIARHRLGRSAVGGFAGLVILETPLEAQRPAGSGMVIPSLAFLAVGLIASAKIGGGSNLHNIDMFWITLALIAAWAWKEVCHSSHLAVI